jgi:hypothetical protein
MADPISDLAPLLDRNLSRGGGERVLRPIDLRTLTGGQVSELAEQLSGHSRKGQPRAYLSARRQVERWRRGSKPKIINVQRIERAGRENRQRIGAFNQQGADMRLQIEFYEGRKPEWLPKGRWLHIKRGDTQRVIRAWRDSDREYAAELLLIAFLAEYEVPNPLDWMQNITIIGLELEPDKHNRKELWKL